MHVGHETRTTALLRIPAQDAERNMAVAFSMRPELRVLNTPIWIEMEIDSGIAYREVEIKNVFETMPLQCNDHDYDVNFSPRLSVKRKRVR